MNVRIENYFAVHIRTYSVHSHTNMYRLYGMYRMYRLYGMYGEYRKEEYIILMLFLLLAHLSR